MKVTLDIVITHYNEQFKIVEPLLDSIQIQRNVDFNDINVIIVNDGNINCITPSHCKKYSFKVSCITVSHAGISNARNVGLENGSSDYVMFCDCDDCFYHVSAIRTILDFAKNNYDMIINNFYEETNFNNEKGVVKHTNDEVFVHGKVYNRQFLNVHSLKFNAKLKYHEDYYFNKISMTIADNIYCIDEPLYLWCTREDSVCRKEPDYMQSTYCQLIDVNDCILEKFVELGLVNDTIKLFVQFVYSTFFDMCKDVWETSKYREVTEKRFAEFFRKYFDYYKICPAQKKCDWYNLYRTNSVKNGMLFEPFTYLEWINKILEVK